MRGQALLLAILVSTGGCSPDQRAQAVPTVQEPTGRSPGASGSTHDVVWVAAESAGRVVKVDISTRRVLRRIRTGGGPHNIAVGPDGTIAASLYGSDSVAVVRHGHLKKVHLGGRPHDVKFDGRRIVVTNEGADRLDVVSVGGKRLFRVPLSASPHDVAIAPNGTRALVTMDGTGRLAVVNLRTRRVHYVSTGYRPHDLLFSPGGRLFVTDWGGSLLKLTATGRLLERRRLGKEAHHLAFTPDGRQVWVTDNALHEIFVLATATLRVVARIRVAGAPHHVAVTPDGRYAVVANNTRGTVIVYSVKTRRRLASIPVGAGPHGVWAVPRSA